MIYRKTGFQPARILLAGIVCLLFPFWALAQDGKVLGTQGLINPGGNPKKSYLVVNEMKVYIDRQTELWDHRKEPILINELTPKRWVYMEVEMHKNMVRAKKIYLLPHYINPEERKKFPFMNQSSLR